MRRLRLPLLVLLLAMLVSPAPLSAAVEKRLEAVLEMLALRRCWPFSRDPSLLTSPSSWTALAEETLRECPCTAGRKGAARSRLSVGYSFGRLRSGGGSGVVRGCESAGLEIESMYEVALPAAELEEAEVVAGMRSSLLPVLLLGLLEEAAPLRLTMSDAKETSGSSVDCDSTEMSPAASALPFGGVLRLVLLGRTYGSGLAGRRR